MFSAPHQMAALSGWQSQRSTLLLVTKAGVAGGGALFIHGVTLNHKNDAGNTQAVGEVVKTSKQAGNPVSAMPIKGLSVRGQKLVAPRSYGQRPPQICGQRYGGEIPQAFRSTKG